MSSTLPRSMQLLVCTSLGIKTSDSQRPGCLYYTVSFGGPRMDLMALLQNKTRGIRLESFSIGIVNFLFAELSLNVVPMETPHSNKSGTHRILYQILKEDQPAHPPTNTGIYHSNQHTRNRGTHTASNREAMGTKAFQRSRPLRQEKTKSLFSNKVITKWGDFGDLCFQLSTLAHNPISTDNFPKLSRKSSHHNGSKPKWGIWVVWCTTSKSLSLNTTRQTTNILLSLCR